MKTLKFGISILGAALLAACGGSDSPHGALIDSPVLLATLTKSQFDSGPLVNLSGPAKCDVKVVSLNYVTPGVKGESSNASGVLLLPTGDGCTAAAPLVAEPKPRTPVCVAGNRFSAFVRSSMAWA